MRKSSLIIAIVILLGASIPVMAQDEERDLLEVCVYGGYGFPSGGASDFGDSLGAKAGLLLGGDLGYFLRYNMVIGFNFTYTQFGIDATGEVGDRSHRLYNPNLYLKYYFMGESDLEPYLKAHVGIENAKFTTLLSDPAKYRATSYDPSLAFGFGGGLFYYTADYSGIFIEANYHYANTDGAKKEYLDQTLEFEDNIAVFDIHAGIRFLIGSGE